MDHHLFHCKVTRANLYTELVETITMLQTFKMGMVSNKSCTAQHNPVSQGGSEFQPVSLSLSWRYWLFVICANESREN